MYEASLLSEKENHKKELEECRNEINNIDDEIINLLNKRGNLVVRLGNLKKFLSMEVYQPDREKEIVERLKTKSTVFKASSVEAIWNEIISASKVIQGSIAKVGFLGPIGTFTHQAALDFFPKSGTEFIPCSDSLEIFDNIEKDLLEYGVVPIENSLQGTVRETLDLLIEKDLIIYGEVELRIVQNLLFQWQFSLFLPFIRRWPEV